VIREKRELLYAVGLGTLTALLAIAILFFVGGRGR
jgi:hypothetical protein